MSCSSFCCIPRVQKSNLWHHSGNFVYLWKTVDAYSYVKLFTILPAIWFDVVFNIWQKMQINENGQSQILRPKRKKKKKKNGTNTFHRQAGSQSKTYNGQMFYLFNTDACEEREVTGQMTCYLPMSITHVH